MTTLQTDYILLAADHFDQNHQYIHDDKDAGNKAIALFNRCINCNCCTRHNVNKPTSWNPLPEEDNEIIGPTQNRDNHFCKCRCRHYARTLCRRHPNSTYYD